jgi:hypothetical protein
MKSLFGINHHETVSRGSFRKMNGLQEKHHALLAEGAGDPEIDDMIAFFAPFHTDWQDSYIIWKSAFDTSQGATAELKTNFASLIKEKVPAWENKIYSFYPDGSDPAKAILPNKRGPFNKGRQFDRITAIKTLATNIGNDTNLATLKTQILAFHTQILASYEKKIAAKKKVGDASKNLEPLRIDIAQAMFANEGALMKKFYLHPEKVDQYFDVAAMRHHTKPTTEEGGYDIPLQPAEIKLLDVRFDGTETWECSNEGDHDVCVFFSDTDKATAIPATDIYKILTGDTLLIELKNVPSVKRYAYAANLSLEDEGEMNITEVG